MAEDLERWNGTEWVTNAAVNRIVVGGGGEPTTGDYRVRFIDYDGTILKTAYCNRGGSVTAPAAPDHTADGLTFQEWNYAESALSSITSDLDIGATYITTDGKTHFYITLTAVSGNSTRLYLNKSDTSQMTIEWGDGTSETLTTSGNFYKSHTYSAVGNYIIKFWISSGSGTYGFGDGSYSALGGNNSTYRQTLTKAYIGANTIALGVSCFYYNLSLVSVSIPNNITTLGENAFYNCFSLVAVIIPENMSSVGNSIFRFCRALQSASLPAGFPYISVTMFSDCISLASIVVPSGTTAIKSSAFYNCYSLATVTISGQITAIGDSSFYYCYSLRSIVVPNSVTSIGGSVFAYCYALKSCKICAISPPTLGTASFANVTNICKIKVLDASLATYQAATNWSSWAGYMEGY